MGRQIVVIQGHPDSTARHFGQALADAYTDGARQAGHSVTLIRVAELDFPLLHTKEEWSEGELPPGLEPAQKAISAADHIVIFYPLWLGAMPALLKGFLEQVLRPGFAMSFNDKGQWIRHLKGRSARIVITMGMPALAYRWYFGAHSLKSLERNILKFVGIKPVRATLIGMVEAMSNGKRKRWFERMHALGRQGR